MFILPGKLKQEILQNFTKYNIESWNNIPIEFSNDNELVVKFMTNVNFQLISNNYIISNEFWQYFKDKDNWNVLKYFKTDEKFMFELNYDYMFKKNEDDKMKELKAQTENNHMIVDFKVEEELETDNTKTLVISPVVVAKECQALQDSNVEKKLNLQEEIEELRQSQLKTKDDRAKYLNEEIESLNKKIEKLSIIYPLKSYFNHKQVAIKYDIKNLYGLECTEFLIAGLDPTLFQTSYLIRTPEIYYNSYEFKDHLVVQIEHLLELEQEDFVDIYGTNNDRINLEHIYNILKKNFKEELRFATSETFEGLKIVNHANELLNGFKDSNVKKV